MNTPPLRDYTAFKGWKWIRVTDTTVRIWTETRCDQCWTLLVLNSYTITESQDAALNLSGLVHCPTGLELPPQATMDFAGAPTMCPFHAQMWREGKVLPSELGVVEEQRT